MVLSENDVKVIEINRQMPEDLEPTLSDACTEFQAKAIEIRKQKPQWTTYYQGQLISREDYETISRYESLNPVERERTLSGSSEKLNFIRTLLNLMGKISKESVLQYTVTAIDDMLQDSKQRVELYHEYARSEKENIYAIFLRMLYKDDPFIVNQICRIISKIACWSVDLMPQKELNEYYSWIIEHLNERNIYKETMCRCLQMMLRINDYRLPFYHAKGVDKIARFLESSIKAQSKDQIQYQLVCCLWLLTFNQDIVNNIEEKYSLIPVVADILNSTEKEKVKRIIVAFFRNLIEKPELDIIRANSLRLLQFKVKRLIDLMHQAQIQDQDIIEDIDFLTKKLDLLVNDVTSFDEYVAELTSCRLTWSPVHRSDKFWRENAARLNENNFYLVKHLIHLLRDDRLNSQALEVAAFDLGEYVRYYPRGKGVIEQLDGKSAIMNLINHSDMGVRYQALLCVQKLMVQNWEYFAKTDEAKNPMNNLPSSNIKSIETK